MTDIFFFAVFFFVIFSFKSFFYGLLFVLLSGRFYPQSFFLVYKVNISVLFHVLDFSNVRLVNYNLSSRAPGGCIYTGGIVIRLLNYFLSKLLSQSFSRMYLGKEGVGESSCPLITLDSRIESREQELTISNQMSLFHS